MEGDFSEELALGLEYGFDGAFRAGHLDTKFSGLIICNIFGLDGMLDDLINIVKIFECKYMLNIGQPTHHHPHLSHNELVWS